jgi:dimethylargininase
MTTSAPLALVRGVPASFAAALSATPPDPPIDVARARAQHAAYVEALGWLGYRVEILPAEETYPDCCFIEDTAVLGPGGALVTRPGAPSRRGEVDAVAEALKARMTVARMYGAGTLDGGDCLRIGRRVWVGLTARTDAAGAASLAHVGLEVTTVQAPGVLHLKCVCAPLGDGRVVVAEGALPEGTFGDVPVVTVPAAEGYAANVVARQGRALVAAGYPAARRALEAAGLEVLALDTSEFRKADGALTCLSLRFDG